MTQGFRQRTGDRPALKGAPFYGAGWEAAHAIPFADRVALTAVLYVPVTALVIRLFFPSRPSAVARFVVTVGIDAIQCVCRWAWSHVSQERGEVVAPFRAHRDPSPAVVLVMRNALVEAARFCRTPRTIGARAAVFLEPRASFAVFQLSLGAPFRMEAATTARQSTLKARANNNGRAAAFTLTSPCGFASESRFAWSTR